MLCSRMFPLVLSVALLNAFQTVVSLDGPWLCYPGLIIYIFSYFNFQMPLVKTPMSASFCSHGLLEVKRVSEISNQERKKGKAQKNTDGDNICSSLNKFLRGTYFLDFTVSRESNTGRKVQSYQGKTLHFSVVETKSIFGVYMEYTGVWSILEYMEGIFDQDNLASCVMLILKSGVSVLSKSSLPTRPLL